MIPSLSNQSDQQCGGCCSNYPTLCPLFCDEHIFLCTNGVRSRLHNCISLALMGLLHLFCRCCSSNVRIQIMGLPSAYAPPQLHCIIVSLTTSLYRLHCRSCAILWWNLLHWLLVEVRVCPMHYLYWWMDWAIQSCVTMLVNWCDWSLYRLLQAHPAAPPSLLQWHIH